MGATAKSPRILVPPDRQRKGDWTGAHTHNDLGYIKNTTPTRPTVQLQSRRYDDDSWQRKSEYEVAPITRKKMSRGGSSATDLRYRKCSNSTNGIFSKPRSTPRLPKLQLKQQQQQIQAPFDEVDDEPPAIGQSREIHGIVKGKGGGASATERDRPPTTIFAAAKPVSKRPPRPQPQEQQHLRPQPQLQSHPQLQQLPVATVAATHPTTAAVVIGRPATSSTVVSSTSISNSTRRMMREKSLPPNQPQQRPPRVPPVNSHGRVAPKQPPPQTTHSVSGGGAVSAILLLPDPVLLPPDPVLLTPTTNRSNYSYKMMSNNSSRVRVQSVVSVHHPSSSGSGSGSHGTTGNSTISTNSNSSSPPCNNGHRSNNNFSHHRDRDRDRRGAAAEPMMTGTEQYPRRSRMSESEPVRPKKKKQKMKEQQQQQPPHPKKKEEDEEEENQHFNDSRLAAVLVESNPADASIVSSYTSYPRTRRQRKDVDPLSAGIQKTEDFLEGCVQSGHYWTRQVSSCLKLTTTVYQEECLTVSGDLLESFDRERRKKYKQKRRHCSEKKNGSPSTVSGSSRSRLLREDVGNESQNSIEEEDEDDDFDDGEEEEEEEEEEDDEDLVVDDESVDDAFPTWKSLWSKVSGRSVVASHNRHPVSLSEKDKDNEKYSDEPPSLERREQPTVQFPPQTSSSRATRNQTLRNKEAVVIPEILERRVYHNSKHNMSSPPPSQKDPVDTSNVALLTERLALERLDGGGSAIKSENEKIKNARLIVAKRSLSRSRNKASQLSSVFADASASTAANAIEPASIMTRKVDLVQSRADLAEAAAARLSSKFERTDYADQLQATENAIASLRTLMSDLERKVEYQKHQQGIVLGDELKVDANLWDSQLKEVQAKLDTVINDTTNLTRTYSVRV